MLTDQIMLAIAVDVARLFELAGIAVIIIGAIIAAVKFGRNLVVGRGSEAGRERDLVARFRSTLGRSILTGLELLVAADIIRTVAVDPTLESVLVLGLIVIIRTFLSFSLEVEIDGKWPWQKGAEGKS
ncbi:Protein of unknown function [Altererythrobacter xiamenensis]|uniref:DUF1622 domain-containing protein n=2 Tax=Altererythrobacter xiamenensis TaxID=1316679 RepID=A0A1Y6EFJ7_9SPHN|nr:Protein of unknown function [Altererythrobacter xiamenensis]